MINPPFSPEEIDRYARHLVLPEIGGAGQQRLKAARALVIGAGGLGAPVIQYLAAAGVGTLRIVDDDAVALSNLQRQVIHTTTSLGAAKVASAKEAVAALNPHVAVEAMETRFDDAHAAALLEGVTVAIDGTDSFAARQSLAEACETACVPLVTAAVGRFDGQITTLDPARVLASGEKAPRFCDLYPIAPEPGTIPPCAVAGVLGALTGVMGTLQAMEAIKLITGAGEPLIGRVMLFDALAMRFDTMSYKRKA